MGFSPLIWLATVTVIFHQRIHIRHQAHVWCGQRCGCCAYAAGWCRAAGDDWLLEGGHWVAFAILSAHSARTDHCLRCWDATVFFSRPLCLAFLAVFVWVGSAAGCLPQVATVKKSSSLEVVNRCFEDSFICGDISRAVFWPCSSPLPLLDIWKPAQHHPPGCRATWWLIYIQHVCLAPPCLSGDRLGFKAHPLPVSQDSKPLQLQPATRLSHIHISLVALFPPHMFSRICSPLLTAPLAGEALPLSEPLLLPVPRPFCTGRFPVLGWLLSLPRHPVYFVSVGCNVLPPWCHTPSDFFLSPSVQ